MFHWRLATPNFRPNHAMEPLRARAPFKHNLLGGAIPGLGEMPDRVQAPGTAKAVSAESGSIDPKRSWQKCREGTDEAKRARLTAPSSLTAALQPLLEGTMRSKACVILLLDPSQVCSVLAGGSYGAMELCALRVAFSRPT